jgi:hypothetical protein
VWSWKQPGYTNVCSSFLAQPNLAAADKAKVNLKAYPGYFEAGSALLLL